jgi:hypothetical protein
MAGLSSDSFSREERISSSSYLWTWLEGSSDGQGSSFEEIHGGRVQILSFTSRHHGPTRLLGGKEPKGIGGQVGEAGG